MKKCLAFAVVMCMVLVFSPAAYAVTPAYEDAMAWNKTSLKCYINPDVTYNYGTSIFTAISSGITSWNSTLAPSVTISDDHIFWDINVEMDDMGETGWNGYCLTYFTETADGNITDYALIYLNTGHVGNYASDSNLWKAIACHETGHAHGLDHNTTNNESSIMKSETTSFYNYAGTWPRWTAPQPADRTAVNNIYQ